MRERLTCVDCSVKPRAAGFDCGPKPPTPLGSATDGYFTHDDDDADVVGATGGVDDALNNCSMRSKFSCGMVSLWGACRSLPPPPVIVQTFCRPRTRLAGIFDQTQRRSLSRVTPPAVAAAAAAAAVMLVDDCVLQGLVATDACWGLTTLSPGRHGCARNAGNGGGTNTVALRTSSRSAVADNDADVFILQTPYVQRRLVLLWATVSPRLFCCCFIELQRSRWKYPSTRAHISMLLPFVIATDILSVRQKTRMISNSPNTFSKPRQKGPRFCDVYGRTDSVACPF